MHISVPIRSKRGNSDNYKEVDQIINDYAKQKVIRRNLVLKSKCCVNQLLRLLKQPEYKGLKKT